MSQANPEQTKVTPLDYLFSLEFFGIKLGLDNIRDMMAAAGNPQSTYPIVHVAGTNGKGSVLAFLDAILLAAGYKTGRFTSPHLISVNERFLVNGIPIDDAALNEHITYFQNLCAKRGLSPTFFEMTTAIAFRHFAQEKVDIALIEVGMGGRLDSTNIVTPILCAITNIALEHTEHLGKTLAAIAGEKAGIIKPGVPVVTGEDQEEALSVIKAKAKELGAELVEATSPSLFLAPRFNSVEATSSSLFLAARFNSVEATSSSLNLGANKSDGDVASTMYFDCHQPIGHVHSGNLPHWRQAGVTYFVTWRTADSMPKERIEQWLSERKEWLTRHPGAHSVQDKVEYDHLFNARWEAWLDECHGECLLREPSVKLVVEDALRYGNGKKYRLDEFVVMPNHVHVLLTPLDNNILSEIVKAWKSFTAHKINQITGRKGSLWQKESFDHIVRSPEEIVRISQYIQDNPVNATYSSLPFSNKKHVEATSPSLFLATRSDQAKVTSPSLQSESEKSDGDVASTCLKLGLGGEYQRRNAAIAIHCAELLQSKFDRLDRAAIVRGLESACWPCRMERVSENPPIIIDVAHNPAGAQQLCRAIDRCVCVLAVSADKDAAAMIEALAPCVDLFLLSAFQGNRAMPVEKLSQLAADNAHESFDTLEKAITRGITLARNDLPLLITGSIFTAGEARKLLMEMGLANPIRFV